MSEYNPQALQAKWQQRWEELDPFRASEDPADTRERRYMLDMFPYPSGDLHMGHAEVFAIGDVGRPLLVPAAATTCCTRSAGTPSACPPRTPRSSATPTPPSGPTPTSRRRPTRSSATRISFDWSRRLHTSDPEYYRWNQWLFIRFFERGLAYRKGGLVNWCPNDQTVLANEQVVGGQVRALRRRRDPPRADPVVLQDH